MRAGREGSPGVGGGWPWLCPPLLPSEFLRVWAGWGRGSWNSPLDWGLRWPLPVPPPSHYCHAKCATESEPFPPTHLVIPLASSATPQGCTPPCIYSPDSWVRNLFQMPLSSARGQDPVTFRYPTTPATPSWRVTDDGPLHPWAVSFLHAVLVAVTRNHCVSSLWPVKVHTSPAAIPV